MREAGDASASRVGHKVKINGKGSPPFMIERVLGTHKGQSEPGLPKEEYSPRVNKLIVNKKGQINGELAYCTDGCCNVLYLMYMVLYSISCVCLCRHYW